MAISADPDQLASEEANWSEYTLFAKAGHIQAQQDNGYFFFFKSTDNKKECKITQHAKS